MSASSASSLARGGDIIDLDRYMRSSVRPSNPRHTRERLVVDAGGAGRVPVGSVQGSGTDSGRRVGAVGRGTGSERRVGAVGRGTGSERERSKRERSKRYWHDSGLSDSSYGQRKPRAHRRLGEAHRRLRASSGARPAASQSSVREFRAACEKALRDQQQQIQRVAELCQMLIQPPASQDHTTLKLHPDTTLDNNKHVQNTERIDAGTPNDTTLRVQKLLQDAEVSLPQNYDILKLQSKKNFGQNVSPGAPRRRRQESDSSDVTSSSSEDERKKDRHRTESCKTYNIIMNKLDELGRLFAARRHVSVAPVAAKRDQVVATEPDADTVQVMHVRRADTRCRVTRVHELDIAPTRERSEGDANSGAGWWSDASVLSDAQPYDVDNPLRLYAQAKRLQALHASTRRARRHSPPNKLGDQLADKLDDKLGDKLSRSVCALCRGYWRAVRRCVTQQLFGACY